MIQLLRNARGDGRWVRPGAWVRAAGITAACAAEASGPERRGAGSPGQLLLVLCGEAEQGRLVGVARDEHHADRKSAARLRERQRDRGLAGHVERRREREAG